MNFPNHPSQSKGKLEMPPSQLQMLEKKPVLNHSIEWRWEKKSCEFVTSMWLTQRTATHIILFVKSKKIYVNNLLESCLVIPLGHPTEANSKSCLDESKPHSRPQIIFHIKFQGKL